MSGIGSWSRRHLLEVAWGGFAAANLAGIVLLNDFATVSFHAIWVSLILLYSRRVWNARTTVALAALITGLSGGALGLAVLQGHVAAEELHEIPLMVLMFGILAWHATQRQEVIRTLRGMAATERHLRERQREFVQDASHELRTPITIARGHGELLRAAIGTQAESGDVDVVLDELDRLAKISERLLLLAAADETTFVRVEDVDLREFVGLVAHRWIPTAARRWEVSVGSDGVIPIDAERMHSAMDALLENAVAFTGPEDVIRIVGRRDGGEAVLAVEDTGRGIPADRLSRIFERFARVDADHGRATGGTGLGLAIVKTIVDAHGGRISAWSEPGHGSRFEIRLPESRRNDAARPSSSVEGGHPSPVP